MSDVIELSFRNLPTRIQDNAESFLIVYQEGLGIPKKSLNIFREFWIKLLVDLRIVLVAKKPVVTGV